MVQPYMSCAAAKANEADTRAAREEAESLHLKAWKPFRTRLRFQFPFLLKRDSFLHPKATSRFKTAQASDGPQTCKEQEVAEVALRLFFF